MKTKKTKSEKLFLRHGDVILDRMKAPPTAGQIIKARTRGTVLADGEVTGHAHTLPAEHTVLHRPTDEEAKLDPQLVGYLQVLVACAVAHEEHTESPVTPGWYKVRVKRQYTPDGWARVVD